MKRRIFTKILLTYICVATAALSLMVPLYRIALANRRQAVLEEQNSLIVQGYQDSVASLDYFKQIAYNLTQQNEMRRLAMCRSGDADLAIRLYDVRELLKRQITSNPLDCELIFTFPANEAVVTTARVFESREAFYGKFFAYEGMSFGTWEQALATRSPGFGGAAWTVEGRSYPSVTYNLYYEEGAIAVSLVVDAGAMLRHIATQDILSSGWMELRDQRFGTLAQVGRPLPDSGLRVGAQVNTSSLQVLGGVSHALVEKGVAPIRALLLLYGVAAVVVFIGLSIFFAVGHARPLSHMVQALGDFLPPARREQSPYKDLQNGVDSVVDTYARVRLERDTLDHSYRSTLIGMALRGAPMQGEVARAVDEVPVLRGCYRAASLGGAACAGVEEWADRVRQRGEGAYFHRFKDSAVLLLPELAGSQLCAPVDWLAELTPGPVGISKPHAGPGELAEAVREAAQALRTAEQTGLSAAEYAPNEAVALPQVDRARFWNVLLHEGEEDVRAWFSALLADRRMYADAAAGAMLYYHILLILQQMHVQLLRGRHFDYELYSHDRPVEENFSLLEKLALAFNHTLKARGTDGRSDVLEQALAYIQSGYRSSSLSLSAAALHAGLSERYLSALMTERLGCSYMDYVGKLRMEEAERLLLETELSVADVAARAGYEYTNTFFKAFRRWSGMTPTQYRREELRRRAEAPDRG